MPSASTYAVYPGACRNPMVLPTPRSTRRLRLADFKHAFTSDESGLKFRSPSLKRRTAAGGRSPMDSSIPEYSTRRILDGHRGVARLKASPSEFGALQPTVAGRGRRRVSQNIAIPARTSLPSATGFMTPVMRCSFPNRVCPKDFISDAVRRIGCWSQLVGLAQWPSPRGVPDRIHAYVKNSFFSQTRENVIGSTALTLREPDILGCCAKAARTRISPAI
jgi:hypothetical protein